MSRPPTAIVPAVGSSNPAIIRSVVVLPQPDGPMIEKNSPAAISQVEVAHSDAVAEALLDARDVNGGVAHRPGTYRACPALRPERPSEPAVA